MRNIEFHTSGVVRLTSIPIESLENILSGRNYLDLLKNKTFLEAVELASVDLLNILSKFDQFNDRKKEKIIISLLKYYTRAATRTTPFGFFAGCSFWKFSEVDNLLIDSRLSKKNIQFNIYHYWELVSFMSKNGYLSRNTLYTVNNTIYKCANKIRYLDMIMIDHYACYQLSEIDFESEIYLFLKNVQVFISYDNVVFYFVDKGYSISDSEYIVDKLIENNILLSEYDFLFESNEIIRQLRKMFFSSSIEADLKNRMLSWITEYELLLNNDFTHQEYKSLELYFYLLFPQIYSKYLFHFDFNVGLIENKLDSKIKLDLIPAVKFLIQYFKVDKKNNLEEFIEKFSLRYEEQSLPLYRVLDPDMGLGYPIGNIREDKSALLKNVKINGAVHKRKCQFSDLEIVLLKKLVSNNGGGELFLSDEDFQDLQREDAQEKNLMAAYLEYGKHMYNGDNVVYLKLLSQNSTKIMNRFSLSDKNISSLVRELSIIEQELLGKDKIIAEIKFYNPSLGYNVVNLPHFRSYEIVYFSNTISSNKIDISDIFISIRNGKIVLYSEKYGKEIVPCLSNAYNYLLLNIPIYRFLCDVQEEHMGDRYLFSWGNLRTISNFFPRVIYKNVILSLAFWIFKRSEYDFFFNSKSDDELLEESQKFVKKFNMPRYVYYNDPSLDNNLFVDWDFVDSIKVLISSIRNVDSIELVEHLCNFSNSSVVDFNNNHYMNEFVIPFSVI